MIQWRREDGGGQVKILPNLGGYVYVPPGSEPPREACRGWRGVRTAVVHVVLLPAVGREGVGEKGLHGGADLGSQRNWDVDFEAVRHRAKTERDLLRVEGRVYEGKSDKRLQTGAHWQ